MKCPMTFNDPCSDAERDCIGQECAWWVTRRTNLGNTVLVDSGCSVPFIAAKGLGGATINGVENKEVRR